MVKTEKKEEYEWVDKYGDHSQVPVPKTERRSFLAIFYVYTGVLACIAVLWGGATLGTQFTLTELFWVAITGSVILAVIGGLTGYIGGHSKGSTYLNMRFPFGKIGSQLFGTISSGISSGIGWFGVQAWLFGIIAHTLYPGYILTNVGVAAIWGGVLMVLTAYLGFKGLAYISYIAVPFFMILAGVGMMMGIEQTAGGFGALSGIKPSNPVPFSVGVTEIVGMYIAGAIITADISRYAKKAWHGSAAWIVQIIVLQPYMLIGAGILTMATGAANVAGALLAGGAGLGAFLIAVLGQWSTNDNNLYSGSLAFNTWIPIKKKYIVLLEGAVGIAIAAFVGFSAGASMAPFQDFLSLLGKVLPAIAGALIADYYVYRWYKGVSTGERYQFNVGMKVPRVNWVGWLAVGCGISTAFLLEMGIPAVNAIIVSGVVYSVLSIGLDKADVSLTIGETTIDETGM